MTPDPLVSPFNAINTLFIVGDLILAKGAAAYAGSALGTAEFVRNVLGAAELAVNRSAGALFLAVPFAAGFTLGYFVDHEIRILFHPA